jgi:hypothetical protein
LATLIAASAAAQESVISTLHNLSVTGPGDVRALNEAEVCKFCHIPHNAVVNDPLWGHALSKVQYTTSKLRLDKEDPTSAPQPDGSSRLCLSCHDGSVALGDIGQGANAIAMAGTQRLEARNRGFLGTDLSGSHPVSFRVPDGDAVTRDTIRDIGLKPLGMVKSDSAVRLDGQDKMQCTTCHDPHSDRYYEEGRVPRFWVKPSVEEVCLTCHELR